jgi:hypothetical protein
MIRKSVTPRETTTMPGDQGFLRKAHTSVDTLPIRAARANRAPGSKTSTIGLLTGRYHATHRTNCSLFVPYLQ